MSLSRRGSLFSHSIGKQEKQPGLTATKWLFPNVTGQAGPTLNNNGTEHGKSSCLPAQTSSWAHLPIFTNEQRTRNQGINKGQPICCPISRAGVFLNKMAMEWMVKNSGWAFPGPLSVPALPRTSCVLWGSGFFFVGLRLDRVPVHKAYLQMFHLIKATLGGWHNYPLFTDGKTEAWRHQVSLKVTQPEAGRTKAPEFLNSPTQYSRGLDDEHLSPPPHGQFQPHQGSTDPCSPAQSGGLQSSGHKPPLPSCLGGHSSLQNFITQVGKNAAPTLSWV